MEQRLAQSGGRRRCSPTPTPHSSYAVCMAMSWVTRSQTRGMELPKLIGEGKSWRSSATSGARERSSRVLWLALLSGFSGLSQRVRELLRVTICYGTLGLVPQPPANTERRDGNFPSCARSRRQRWRGSRDALLPPLTSAGPSQPRPPPRPPCPAARSRGSWPPPSRGWRTAPSPQAARSTGSSVFAGLRHSSQSSLSSSLTSPKANGGSSERSTPPFVRPRRETFRQHQPSLLAKFSRRTTKSPAAAPAAAKATPLRLLLANAVPHERTNGTSE